MPEMPIRVLLRLRRVVQEGLHMQTKGVSGLLVSSPYKFAQRHKIIYIVLISASQ